MPGLRWLLRRRIYHSNCSFVDANFVIVNKPAGMVVHAGAGPRTRHVGERAPAPLGNTFRRGRYVASGHRASPGPRNFGSHVSGSKRRGATNTSRSNSGREMSGKFICAGTRQNAARFRHHYAADLSRSAPQNPDDGAWANRTTRANGLARGWAPGSLYARRGGVAHGPHAPDSRALCRDWASGCRRHPVRRAARRACGDAQPSATGAQLPARRAHRILTPIKRRVGGSSRSAAEGFAGILRADCGFFGAARCGNRCCSRAVFMTDIAKPHYALELPSCCSPSPRGRSNLSRPPSRPLKTQVPPQAPAQVDRQGTIVRNVNPGGRPVQRGDQARKTCHGFE